MCNAITTESSLNTTTTCQRFFINTSLRTKRKLNVLSLIITPQHVMISTVVSDISIIGTNDDISAQFFFIDEN
jgi:hypothetical protein